VAISFKVNGGPVSVDAPKETPLLGVIREQLKLTGTKFGCGAGPCGTCRTAALRRQRLISQ